METTLKQRLIGAAVVIALAVIFVPMILDGSGREESIGLNMEVPPEPTFTFDSQLPDPKKLEELPEIEQELKQSDPVQASGSNQSEAVSQDTANGKVETEVSKLEEKQVDKAKPVVEATSNHIKTKPELSAWAVQVAAFGEKEKAITLQEKLLASNLPAFTERSNKGGKVLYRVKVGPELRREDAEKLRDKIEKEHGLKDSFVTNHP